MPELLVEAIYVGGTVLAATGRGFRIFPGDTVEVPADIVGAKGSPYRAPGDVDQDTRLRLAEYAVNAEAAERGEPVPDPPAAPAADDVPPAPDLEGDA